MRHSSEQYNLPFEPDRQMPPNLRSPERVFKDKETGVEVEDMPGAREALVKEFRRRFEDEEPVVVAERAQSVGGSVQCWEFDVSNMPRSPYFRPGPVRVYPDGKVLGLPNKQDLREN